MPARAISHAEPTLHQLISRVRWHNAAIAVQAGFVKFVCALEWAKYNPDQPRVPSGSSDGGQWTGVGDGGRVQLAELQPGSGGQGRVISDAPSNSVRLAGGAPIEPDPLRAAEKDPNFREDRLFTVIRNPFVRIDEEDIVYINTSRAAETAVNTVRRLEPDWAPTPGLYNDTQGAIAQNRATTAEAEARLAYQQAFRFGHNNPPDNETDPASMSESSTVRPSGSRK